MLREVDEMPHHPSENRLKKQLLEERGGLCFELTHNSPSDLIHIWKGNLGGLHLDLYECKSTKENKYRIFDDFKKVNQIKKMEDYLTKKREEGFTISGYLVVEFRRGGGKERIQKKLSYPLDRDITKLEMES